MSSEILSFGMKKNTDPWATFTYLLIPSVLVTITDSQYQTIVGDSLFKQEFNFDEAQISI